MIISAFLSCLAILLVKVGIAAPSTEEVVDVVNITPKVRSYSLSIVNSTSEEETGVELLSRVVRSNFCQIPRDYGDSEIVCQCFPSCTICTQTCVYGHCFKSGGNSKKYECRDGQWTPSQPFEKCYPYLDMTVTLMPGGKMRCWCNFMDHGPICEIECCHYEDKSAVAKAIYRYSGPGQWTPQLPFCCRCGSDIALVAVPGSFSGYNQVK
ncbi:hypothetical protein AVEN_111769-1 [Araneus ventricosus]|uniref:Sushi domain-containing protein n=1 Tax=Araneus ventricosus TaxID=182803 RepID=A0A4Y2QNC4_ARAVE|nr:hypothetical protein AVEN_111769-1 [Araneus ventricosus]